jgi:predicted nucleic acid-binding protein
MFFVDTNVVIYTRSSSPYCDPCSEIVTAIAAGEADGCTSTAVLEEVWQLELSERAKRLDGLTTNAYETFRPVLDVTNEIFARALDLHDIRVGANDRVHVATCLANGIDTIVSADRGFDTVEQLRRVDPLDTPAVEKLLAPDRNKSSTKGLPFIGIGRSGKRDTARRAEEIEREPDS